MAPLTVVPDLEVLEDRVRQLQLPMCMLAEAVGDALRRSTVADGLGMALTGVAWVLLAYALTRQPQSDAEPEAAVPGLER